MRRAVFALVAVLVGALAVTRAVHLSDHPLTVGVNHQANRTGAVDANNSASLARDPRRPSRTVLTNRVDRPTFSAVLHHSDDDGSTWHDTALPLPAGIDRPFAPDAAFAPDGTLYVTYVNLTGGGNAPGNLWIARSSDDGRTLSEPVRITGPLAFQARVTVGPEGTVYVTWLQVADIGVLRVVGSPNPVVAVHSTDGGQTFSPPVVVSDPSRPRVGAASPVVDPSGRLTVLYEDFRSDRRDFEFLEGPPADDPFALVVTSSTDGGATFSPGVEAEPAVVPTRRFLVFLPEFPSLAAGPRGELYVSWADGREGDEDVFLRRSDDAGRTWTPPTRVNDNPSGDHTSQYLPRVAVAPSGRVDVVFLDRRRDRARNVKTDAFLASSADRGSRFTNRRLSSRSFDSRVGPVVDETLPIDFGSRLGLSNTDVGALAAWTDSRKGTEGTGRQDVFTARLAPRANGVADWMAVLLPALVALLAAAGAVTGHRSSSS